MSEEKMNVKDKGWAIIEYKDGRKEKVNMKDDLVVSAGLNFYQQRMYSDTPTKMTHGAVGTGTNAPAAGDTTLQTEVLRKALTVTTNPSTGKAHLEFIVDYSEANGNTLTEVGIFNAASSGTMLLRKLFASGIPKTSDKKITVVVETTITAS
jgi:hypothetical protein